jgi:hypothetical protein
MAIVAPTVATAIAAFVWAIAHGGLAAAPFALFLAFASLVCAFFIAGGHVLLLGLPVFLLLRRFTVPGWLLSGACGLVLGAGPFLLIVEARGNWLDDDLSAVLLLGVMGLIGGLGFRWKLYS